MGIIYMATNMVNGKVYIGQTIRTLDARRKDHLRKKGCSHFKTALDSYGHDSFHWDIIDSCLDRSDLDRMESWWIEYMDSLSNGYNLKVGGITPRFSDESKKKMSKAHAGKVLSEEHKRKIGIASAKQKPKTEEQRKKISENNKGRKLTPEQIEKIRKANTGRKLTEEHKRKLSEAHKGKIKSPEHLRKLSESNKGVKRSDETRRRVSESQKGRIPWNKGKSGYKQPRGKNTVLPVLK